MEAYPQEFLVLTTLYLQTSSILIDTIFFKLTKIALFQFFGFKKYITVCLI